MPLNSNHLTDDIIQTLRELPIDDVNDLPPYQNQIALYDSKCNGCGFVRVEAHFSDGVLWNVNKMKVFDRIDDAISFATVNKCQLKRSCCYPSDTLQKHRQPVYPTLAEIISNTCEFWKELNPADVLFTEPNLEDLNEWREWSKLSSCECD